MTDLPEEIVTCCFYSDSTLAFNLYTFNNVLSYNFKKTLGSYAGECIHFQQKQKKTFKLGDMKVNNTSF